MPFSQDLKEGQDVEHKFAELIRELYDAQDIEFPPEWAFKRYDFKVTYKDWSTETYEVKSDRKYPITGNFVIEYECYGKVSWIYASTADRIVYYVWWKWRVQDREVLIERLKDIQKRETYWWDNNASAMYVIKWKYLPYLFDLLDFEELSNAKEND